MGVQGNDGKDWKLVVQEIVRFMKADACCEVGRPLRYSISLDPHYIPEVKSPDVGKPLRLHDAILASYYHNEVRRAFFSLFITRTICESLNM